MLDMVSEDSVGVGISSEGDGRHAKVGTAESHKSLTISELQHILLVVLISHLDSQVVQVLFTLY
jgi:hypothetical protein